MHKFNFNIGDFRVSIPDVSRGKYFKISIPRVSGSKFFTGGTDSENITLIAKASNFPGKTLGVTNLKIQGQPFRVSNGTSIFAEWTVTFYCDIGHTIRNNFMKWNQDCFNPAINVMQIPAEYKADNVVVTQLDAQGNTVASEIFVGMFPSVVGAMTLDQTNQEFATFDVTFAYDYWVLATQLDRIGISLTPQGILSSIGRVTSILSNPLGIVSGLLGR